MFKKSVSRILLFFAGIFAGIALHAQDGAYTGYTPYSVFGIGNINSQVSAYNMGMGGVGIATRNIRYLNCLNPAAITARDSLSVLADMSISENNALFNKGDLQSGVNTFNLNNIAFSFPIYKSSAMMVGIAPFSSVGYKSSFILEDTEIIGQTGNSVYTSEGNGGLYKAFVSAGVTFWNRLSLGVEGIGYFGKIVKESSFTFARSGYSGISNGYDLYLHGVSAKFGLQYEQKIGSKTSVIVGAVCALPSNIKGTSSEYRLAKGVSQTDTLLYVCDTLDKVRGQVNIPLQYGFGISISHGDVWSAEFDYLRSDWTSSGMDKTNGFAINGSSSFSTAVSESYKAGFEIVPNRNDIRYYYRRCAYRVGAYYDREYYKLDGNSINRFGITFGASLPVFRYYNAVTLAVDLGQRASLANNLIRERYINFTFGFNFSDQWFRKAHYE